MKIEIHTSEEDLARLWSDVTWTGKYPVDIREIIHGIIQDRVDATRKTSPHTNDMDEVLSKFRKAHDKLI